MSKIAQEIVPRLKPGTLVIMLDPAVAHADGLPPRPDISYFVTHPCHPSLFEHFETAAERDDFFGGIHARQAIVCALMQGPEAHYALGEELARQFYGPVTRSHRITVEQMAILEPTMAEVCGIALVLALREALDEAVRRGVPRQAAEDFMYGHVKVELGIGFGRAGFPFSDGAKLIAEYGKHRIFRDDWLKTIRAGQRERAGEHDSGREVAGVAGGSGFSHATRNRILRLRLVDRGAGYPLPKPMSAFDLLAEAERLGVRLVQVCDNLPLTRLSAGELDDFERRVLAAGIAVEVGMRGLQPDNVGRTCGWRNVSAARLCESSPTAWAISRRRRKS
jgi:hypothetical protein